MKAKRNRWALLFVLALLLSVNSGCQTKDPARTPVKVVRVVDGDTIRVWYRGKRQLVRLAGIDAPEERINEKARRDAAKSGIPVNFILVMGRRATRFSESVVKRGDIVYLEFDEKKRDDYGRLLAYVWLSDERMLNEVIVSEGYGRAYRIPPNVKYQEKFQSAHERAKESGKGIWR